jgi:hypothetical protein
MSVRTWPAEVCFEAVRARGSRGIGLLIGAGCSRTANIPTAAGFVERICEEYPERCKDMAADRVYEQATNKLSDDEWRGLFGKIVRDAKLNVAHLCIAELVDQGVVDRVLTTNFDSLLIQACALGKRFPFVHDCATADNLDDWIDEAGEAIFYLHGQEHGRKMLNPGMLKLRGEAADLQEEIADGEPRNPLSRLLRFRAKHVSKIVLGTIRRRPLIVCGYSGISDDVFASLRGEDDLNNPVFWVTCTEQDADRACAQFDRPTVSERVYVIPGVGADEFFYELLLGLNLRIPTLLQGRSARTRLAHSRIEWPNDWPNWKEARMRYKRGDPPESTSQIASALAELSTQKEAPQWVEPSS